MAKPLFRRLFSPASPPSFGTVAEEVPPGEAEARFTLGGKLDPGDGEAQDFADAGAACHCVVRSTSCSEVADGNLRVTVFQEEHSSGLRGGA